MLFAICLLEKTEESWYNALWKRFHARSSLTHDLSTDPGFEIVDSFHSPTAMSHIGINTKYGGGTSIIPRLSCEDVMPVKTNFLA